MDHWMMKDFDEMNKKILSVTAQVSDQILERGHALAGHNGPYAKRETPVRNTAYWLMGFSYAYQSCGDERFHDAMKICADYLIGEESRPGGGAFDCMKTDEEKWNGLISQAWVLDALCETYQATGEERFAKIAKDVFLMHGFDHARGLWKKLGINGEIFEEDKIVHHQLWFAAVGAVLANATGDKEVRMRVERFLERLDENLLTYRNGLIMQRIMPRRKWMGVFQPIHRGLGLLKRAVVNPILGKGLHYKETGYHMYNLYAFAIMKNEGVAEGFFASRRFHKMLAYSFSDQLLKTYDTANHHKDSMGTPLKIDMPVNRYAYPYNAPGFAMPYIYYTFRDGLPVKSKEAVDWAVQQQIAITYSEDERRFSMHTEDAETLNARVYQFLRCVTLFGSEP